MKREILFIDDQQKELDLMCDTLRCKFGELNLKVDLSFEQHRICCDNNLKETDLKETVQKIKQLLGDDKKLLVVVDLNLVGRKNITFDQLKKDLMMGILLKRYIVDNLKKEKIAPPQFVFISNYFRAGEPANEYIKKIIEKEQVEGVRKPSRKMGAEQYIETEPAEEKPTCKLLVTSQNQEIQKLYDRQTTYSVFLGKLLENALS